MVCSFPVAMFFALVPGNRKLDDLEFDHDIIRMWMCVPHPAIIDSGLRII
jgi:hypothetical protein